MTPPESMTSLLVMTSVLVVMTSCQSGGVDLTLVAGSQGTAVVMAVVNRIRDRCIFSEDRLFLRRMAYVVSRDGMDSATYSTAHHGGIWQIKEDEFLATQNCNSSLISSACQIILSEFGIDWSNSVTWPDLRKPLYSGFAAALYTLLKLDGSTMPGDVIDQAMFWASAFGGNGEEFVERAPSATDSACSDKMDLVFVLDSSGSVSADSFTLMKSFAADVVQVMDVDGGVVRVANIVYGSYVTEVFDLDDHTSSTQVRDALLATTKLGGGTLTHHALTLAAMTLFDGSKGARDDVKKVAILITDGKSFDVTETASSAVTLKSKGTTVFAIGVGDYSLTELQRVATSPTCSHVFTLTDFSSIMSIVTQIQISTCDASLVLIPGEEVTGEIPEEEVEVVTRTLNPGPNSTITVTAICGELDIYVSYSDRNPSPVVHEEYYHATNGSPAYIHSRSSAEQESPIYITLVASRLVLSGCQRYEWTISVDEPGTKVRLIGGGKDAEGRVEVFLNGYWGTVCDDNFGQYDAIVVCRMLGYDELVPVVHDESYYGPGQGTIWLDEVDCSGAEASLFDCKHFSGGLHDCQHTEDVGVDCVPSNASSLVMVRLVNGSRPSEGRLEVSNGGVWGTVCGDGFDVQDANVVCNMLNFTGYTPAVTMGSTGYGEGHPEGPIWLDDMGCTGTERSIFLCPHAGLGQHNCSHQHDVGLDCLAEPESEPSNGASASSSDSTTGIIAGAVGGAVGLGLLTAAGVLLRKFLTSKAAVESMTNGGDNNADRRGSHTSSSSSSSSEDSFPIPGMEPSAPSMRMPADTHLPPIVNNSPLFPPLRS